MKKKIFSILLVCAMLLGLTACGGNNETPSTEPETKIETQSEETVEKEVALDANGITVEGEIGTATSVTIAEVSDGNIYDDVKSKVPENASLAVWNIDILNDAGSAVQPDGSVKISLKLPKELVKAEGDTYTVYRQEADGTLTKLDSTIEGDTIVFSTEHFSIYVVTKTNSETTNTETDTEDGIAPKVDDEEPEKPEPEPEPEEPKEPEKPTYTYTDLNKTMWAKSSVNVRNLPSTDGEKLGGLSARQEVKVTGQCNETSWYRIEYNGGVGYVSNSYLVNEKPAEPEPPEPPKPDEPVQPDNPEPEQPELPFVLYQVIDTGDKIYYWSEPNNHSPEATAARSAANELATRMAGERWGTNCHGIWDYDQYAGHYFMVCWMKIN